MSAWLAASCARSVKRPRTLRLTLFHSKRFGSGRGAGMLRASPNFTLWGAASGVVARVVLRNAARVEAAPSGSAFEGFHDGGDRVLRATIEDQPSRSAGAAE